ncbi:MAG: hypothetical protein QM743_13400 [Chitinophagaceae bacterium]
MKRSFFLFCYLLFTGTFVQAKLIDPKSLKGPWRETVRMQAGQPVKFRDTLYFEFLSSTMCVWGKTTPSAPRLKAKLTGTTLEIGANEFDILELEGDRMHLAGQDGVELIMQRYNKRPTSVRNSNNVAFRPAPSPKNGTVPDRIEPLVGIWKCYKRTSNKPLDTAGKYRIIRLVAIEETPETITGKIYGFNDPEAKPSWIVQQYEKGILYTAGKDERNFRVINCQPNELVIENEGVVYYMNKL